MVLLLSILACTTPPPADQSPPLRFSAIPDHDTTLLRSRFDPVADYLSDTLEVPVEFVPATDYTASVEMFKNGDIHLAWFGGLTGVQARRAVDGAHAIAQGIEDPQYYAYFIANDETGLKASDTFPMAIASHTFTFGAGSSTSGRLMPEHFIVENTGVGPTEFFAHPFGFSGSHDKTALLVASGRVEVGVLNYKTWDKLVAEGRVDGARVIWKTPVFADYNFTAHPELQTVYGEGFTARLQTALIEMTDPELLNALSRSGLIEASDADFEDIERVALGLKMVN
jgi:phosphonate transport system substrate-binding protein